MRIRKLCSVTHQAAGFGIRAQGIDHWHGMARGQRDELYGTVDEEVVGMDDKCVGPPLHKARKGRVDLSSVLAVKNSICGPMAVATASTSFFSDSVVGFCGLTSTPRCVAAGNSSCKSPSRLATSSLLMELTPVMLPPGRLRLSTRPS